MTILFKETGFNALLRGFANVEGSLTFKDLKPSLELAQGKYLQPILGPTLLSSLLTKYAADDNSLNSEPWKSLLSTSQALCAKFGLAYFGPTSISVGSSGLTFTADENKKTVFPWQRAEFIEAYTNQGYSAAEYLAFHLSVNRGQFSDWADTDYEKEARGWIIQDSRTLGKYLAGTEGNYYLLTYLRPAMRDIQRNRLKPLMETASAGSYAALLEKLTKGQSLTPAEQETLELAEPALAYSAAAEFIEGEQGTLSPEGLRVRSRNDFAGGNTVGKSKGPSEDRFLGTMRVKTEDAFAALASHLLPASSTKVENGADSKVIIL